MCVDRRRRGDSHENASSNRTRACHFGGVGPAAGGLGPSRDGRRPSFELRSSRSNRRSSSSLATISVGTTTAGRARAGTGATTLGAPGTAGAAATAGTAGTEAHITAREACRGRPMASVRQSSMRHSFVRQSSNRRIRPRLLAALRPTTMSSARPNQRRRFHPRRCPPRRYAAWRGPKSWRRQARSVRQEANVKRRIGHFDLTRRLNSH